MAGERHGRSMAWARHAMCESALSPILGTFIKNALLNSDFGRLQLTIRDSFHENPPALLLESRK